MSKKSNQKEMPDKAGEVTFVCPSCLARYHYDRAELTGKAKLCHYCRVPLVQEGPGRNRFRCLNCTRRILTPEGVWCTHFERAPTANEGAQCTEFEARARQRRARRSR